MMLAKSLQSAAGNAAEATYIEDVFSTHLRNGAGSVQTINNGIDLAGKGGMVWVKQRNTTTNNCIFDTLRGPLVALSSNNVNANFTQNSSITQFNSDGFLSGPGGSAYATGANGSFVVSWTFRKQPKFFDVVTYTGNGISGRTVPHNLGSTPGFLIVKCTSTGATNWVVWHRSFASTTTGYLYLNTTQPYGTSTLWGGSAPTESVFSLGDAGDVNSNGATYVAYLFAHDAGGFGLTGTDNVISCGSYTTDGSGNGSATLGWEPQFVLLKSSSGTSSWHLIDQMRGLLASPSNIANLRADLTNAESTGFQTSVNQSGFVQGGGGASVTYIYLAIRMPNKPPTSGTEVFQPVTYTGTNVDNRLVNTGILTDMTMARIRTATSAGGFYMADRLRGNASLGTAISDAENSDADSFMTPTSGYGTSFSTMNGFGVGNDATRQLNQSSTSQLAYAFKRAPGFFDVVCYSGNGVAGNTVTHQLGVAPDFMIVKTRSATDLAQVYFGDPTDYFQLGLTNGASDSPTRWNDTAPTSSVFSLGADASVNSASRTYVAYLFASLNGISKAGTYTGNGSSQTIDCGFVSGARFVFVKRINENASTNRVFDSARGIVEGNDPCLSWDTISAEITTIDVVDADSSGFVVNQEATTNLNVNGDIYFYFAIA